MTNKDGQDFQVMLKALQRALYGMHAGPGLLRVDVQSLLTAAFFRHARSYRDIVGDNDPIWSVFVDACETHFIDLPNIFAIGEQLQRVFVRRNLPSLSLGQVLLGGSPVEVESISNRTVVELLLKNSQAIRDMQDTLDELKWMLRGGDSRSGTTLFAVERLARARQAASAFTSAPFIVNPHITHPILIS